jgi:hypothetical protein
MLKFIHLLLALPLIPLAAAQAPAPQGADNADKEVRCEVRATPMPGGVQLDGIVLSPEALSGSYAFEVRKQGAAGTSRTMQSGDFEAAADEESVLGQVGLGLDRGASYEAELTIRWRGGETDCVKRHPDRV